MVSERAVGRVVVATAVVLGVLAGCRADLLVPAEESVSEAEGLLAYEAWSPVFRVIDVDGLEVGDYRVDLSNVEYYRSSAYPGYDRRQSIYVRHDQLDEVQFEIHPPLVVRVTWSGLEWVETDLTPAPGETLVVDHREFLGSFRVDLDVIGRPAEAWQRMEYRYRTAIAANDSSFVTGYQYYSTTAPAGRAVPLRTPSTTYEIDRLGVEWRAVSDGVEYTGRYNDVNTIGDPVLPLNVRLDVESTEFWVRVTRRGQLVRGSTYSLRCDEPEVDAGHLDFHTSAVPAPTVRGPYRIETLTNRFLLTVEPRSEGSWMVSRTIEVEVAEGDTVDVELAEYDLDVRVLSEGAPVHGAWVELRRAEDMGWGRSATGDDGRVRFGVQAGIYDIMVYPYRYSSESTVRRVRVVADDVVEVELP